MKIFPIVTTDKKFFADYVFSNCDNAFTKKEIEDHIKKGYGHYFDSVVYITKNSSWLLLHELIHHFSALPRLFTNRDCSSWETLIDEIDDIVFALCDRQKVYITIE